MCRPTRSRTPPARDGPPPPCFAEQGLLGPRRRRECEPLPSVVLGIRSMATNPRGLPSAAAAGPASILGGRTTRRRPAAPHPQGASRWPPGPSGAGRTSGPGCREVADHLAADRSGTDPSGGWSSRAAPHAGCWVVAILPARVRARLGSLGLPGPVAGSLRAHHTTPVGQRPCRRGRGGPAPWSSRRPQPTPTTGLTATPHGSSWPVAKVWGSVPSRLACQIVPSPWLVQ
jgi:hypothetical protein